MGSPGPVGVRIDVLVVDGSRAVERTAQLCGPVAEPMFTARDVEIYAAHSQELIRFAASLVGPGAAEDLFAESVLKAFAAPRWPEVVDRRAYLYRTVLHEAITLRRSTNRRWAREIRTAGSGSFTDTGSDQDVLTAVRQLSVRQRAVVFLTYWQDLPRSEVADRLGWSMRTVERELTGARKRLRVALAAVAAPTVNAQPS